MAPECLGAFGRGFAVANRSSPRRFGEDRHGFTKDLARVYEGFTKDLYGYYDIYAYRFLLLNTGGNLLFRSLSKTF